MRRDTSATQGRSSREQDAKDREDTHHDPDDYHELARLHLDSALEDRKFDAFRERGRKQAVDLSRHALHKGLHHADPERRFRVRKFLPACPLVFQPAESSVHGAHARLPVHQAIGAQEHRDECCDRNKYFHCSRPRCSRSCWMTRNPIPSMPIAAPSIIRPSGSVNSKVMNWGLMTKKISARPTGMPPMT